MFRYTPSERIITDSTAALAPKETNPISGFEDTPNGSEREKDEQPSPFAIKPDSANRSEAAQEPGSPSGAEFAQDSEKPVHSELEQEPTNSEITQEPDSPTRAEFTQKPGQAQALPPIEVPDSYPASEAETYFVPADQRRPGNLGGPPPLPSSNPDNVPTRPQDGGFTPPSGPGQ